MSNTKTIKHKKIRTTPHRSSSGQVESWVIKHPLLDGAALLLTAAFIDWLLSSGTGTNQLPFFGVIVLFISPFWFVASLIGLVKHRPWAILGLIMTALAFVLLLYSGTLFNSGPPGI
jgi:hypothetical protein